MKKILFLLMMMAPIATFAQKFGHVNTQEVMQVMPEYAAATAKLEKLQQQYRDELTKMQEEYQKKGEAFQKLPADTPESIKVRNMEELQLLEQRIQETYQQVQQDLAKAEQTEMAAVQEKLLNAVKAVGDEGNFTYIMQSNSIPYISTTLSTDVTAQVKAKLGLK